MSAPYDPKRSCERASLQRATYDFARYLYLEGRITHHEWRAFQLAHMWCAPRFTGSGSIAQERFYRLMGWEALENRRMRAAKLWRRFCAPVTYSTASPTMEVSP